MELIPSHEISIPSAYYLPHSGVFKEFICSTKLFVFYDSANLINGLSLNEALMTGPTVQGDLFSVDIRFRTYKFVMTMSKLYQIE